MGFVAESYPKLSGESLKSRRGLLKQCGVFRVVRVGRTRVVAESVLDRQQSLHAKKDPASCLAGEGGMVEEIVCRWWLQTSLKYTVSRKGQEIWVGRILQRQRGTAMGRSFLVYPTALCNSIINASRLQWTLPFVMERPLRVRRLNHLSEIPHNRKSAAER